MKVALRFVARRVTPDNTCSAIYDVSIVLLQLPTSRGLGRSCRITVVAFWYGIDVTRLTADIGYLKGGYTYCSSLREPVHRST